MGLISRVSSRTYRDRGSSPPATTVKTVVKTVKQKRKVKKTIPQNKDLKSDKKTTKDKETNSSGKTKNSTSNSSNLTSIKTITKSASDLTQPLKRTTSNSSPNTPLLTKSKLHSEYTSDHINNRIQSLDDDLDEFGRQRHNSTSAGLSTAESIRSDRSKHSESFSKLKQSPNHSSKRSHNSDNISIASSSKLYNAAELVDFQSSTLNQINQIAGYSIKNKSPQHQHSKHKRSKGESQRDHQSHSNNNHQSQSNSNSNSNTNFFTDPFEEINPNNQHTHNTHNNAQYTQQNSSDRKKSRDMVSAPQEDRHSNNRNNMPASHREGVGFANLPNQIHQKAIRRGFEFSLMVCGESGLGKSTLLNSLFLTDIYSKEYPGPSKRQAKTVSVMETDLSLEEAGVKLQLTVIDTPGYGDSINNTQGWAQVSDFIEDKFEKYLNDESRVNRAPLPSDKRVHACLYFIAPSGHGTKALDIEFMKRLHDKVNIIPVIAKADAMTPEEIKSFKHIISQQIAENLINVYNFPDLDNEIDNRKLRGKMPFAVIGSNYVMEASGKRVRARQYPWGFAEIENSDHCDFSVLRKMLLQSHMQDLIDVSANYHYENYRQRKLSPVINNMTDHTSSGQESQNGDYEAMQVDKNPIEQIEDEKRNHKTRMAQME